MDQDFYIEETKPIKVIIIIVLLIALIAGGIYAYYNYIYKTRVTLKDVTVELGMPLSNDINDYLKTHDDQTYNLDITNISLDENGNTNSLGEYPYYVNGETKSYKGKLFVVDTTAPIVNVEELTVGVNEEFEASEFITSCNDLSLPCTAVYKNVADQKLNQKEGTYKSKIIVSDKENNTVEKEVILHVSSTETLADRKASDLNGVIISNESLTWNNTYTVKFEKALDDESNDFQSQIQNLSVRDYHFDKQIKNKEIVVVYNKYNYATGLSIVVTFEDDSVLFITNEKYISSEE